MSEQRSTEYRVELSARFDMDIVSTVVGPPGLDRSSVEELIERDWAWISAGKNVLQESSWQLTDFAEIRASPSALPRDHRHSSKPGPEVERTSMDSVSATDTHVWVVLVTDGTVVAYPPEIYGSLSRATSEAERWAWLLSGEGVLEVERPFEARWRVADRDIRLVEVNLLGPIPGLPWVGTYWTRDAAPDPEALVLSGEPDARAWVQEPPSRGLDSPRIFDTPWSSAAIYIVHGEEEYAVAFLAKVVS